MKKLLFLLCACFICLTSIKAQSLTEVLHLKNGSVIRGTIIEQVPNESIKIQTLDGSIFAYSMADVLKITKEQAINNYSNNSVTGFKFQRTGFRNNFAAQRGYKGFVEFGVFFNPSIGCRFGLSESFALNLTFNYGLQTEEAEYYWSGYYESETVLLHTIGFKLGIEF